MSTTSPEQIAEARAICEALSDCDMTLKDRRFVNKWREYLDRTGEAAVIGVYRLEYLRQLRRIYLTDATEPSHTEENDNERFRQAAY